MLQQELSTVPLSLAKTDGCLYESDKPNLARLLQEGVATNAQVTHTAMTHTVIYDARIVINRDIILVNHGRATLQAFALSW